MTKKKSHGALLTTCVVDEMSRKPPTVESILFNFFEEILLKDLDPTIIQLQNDIGAIKQRDRDRLHEKIQLVLNTSKPNF